MHKIFSFIPNLLTSCNLFAGFLSIIFSFNFHFNLAGLCIIFACLFDLADGKVARLLKVNNVIGKEMDSFGDILSFGIAPSFLIFNMGYKFYPHDPNMFLIFLLGSFLYTLLCAIRLSIFNIGAEKFKFYQKLVKKNPTNFTGLPSTFGGLSIAICAAYESFANGIFYHSHIDFSAYPLGMFVFMICLGFLMLVPLEYAKFLNVFFNFKSLKSTVITIVLLVLLVLLSRIVLLLITVYMILAPIVKYCFCFKGKL